MPSKSKKNRRNIAQKKQFRDSPVAKTDSVITSTVTPKNSGPSAVIKPKAAASAAYIPAQTDFARDFKWIGLTAAIVAVLLVISYFVFR